MKLKIFVSLLSVIILLTVSSCKEKGNTEATEYNYQQSDSITEASGQAGADKKVFKVDKSWQKNFSVTYKYFSNEDKTPEMHISEKKSDNAFTVEYLDTKTMLYYTGNGKDTDYYVLVDDEEKQVHSVLRNKDFNSISSMFMKLSSVEENLSQKSNVLYMYDENVAGRNCHKYIQRAYKSGELTESVYIWVDEEFGFAAKCEAYDSDENLVLSWETEAFTSGNLQDKDVSPDLSQYSFSNELG